MISRSCMGERYPGQYDPASMALGRGRAKPVPARSAGARCTRWIALAPAGDVAVVGAPLGDRERVIDRCERCGVALEQGREVDLTAEWDRGLPTGRRAGTEDRDPEPRQPPGRDRRRGLGGDRALPGPAHPHPGEPGAARPGKRPHAEARAGCRSRAGPRHGCGRRCSTGSPSGRTSPATCAPAGCTPAAPASGCASAIDLVVTVLGAPLVALVSVPLELGATLAGRGGELRATAHDLG